MTSVDHFPIIVKLNTPIKVNNNNKNITYKNFSQSHINQFIVDLDAVNWQEFILQCDTHKDVNYSYKKFFEIFNGLYEQNFTSLSKSLPTRRRPRSDWITPGLIISCNTKAKLYKKYKLHPSLDNETNYKTYRNKLKQLLQQTQKSSL